MEGELIEKKDTRKQNCLPRVGTEKKSGDSTRKIAPLGGGLVREMIRCGRATCKCANGSPHGPYYYRVWMVRGIRYKAYVKKADVDRIKATIETFRAQRRKQQESAAEAKTMMREIREERRNVYAILRLRGVKI